MTRFNISLNSAVDMVLWSLENSIGGEIIVPKLKSYRVIDLAKVIDKNLNMKIIGIRQGEKIHEELISKADNFSAYDIKKYYVLLNNDKKLLNYYSKKFSAKKTPSNFNYTSNEKKYFLNQIELKSIVKDFLKKS